MANILLIDDEPILADNICEALRLKGHDVSSTARGEEAVPLAESTHPDVILLDYRLPGIDGLETLRRLRTGGSSAAVIMMTAHGNVHTAVEAMKCGANDFLTKPVDLDELQLVIDRVLKQQALTVELSYFRNRERGETDVENIIGESKTMRQVKAFLERITNNPILSSREPPSLLITGETGTGKDHIARAVHYRGARRIAQFVQVNCTAVPDQLVESELFGHVKGAFTDARHDKRGLFEIADHGTIFLNEIGHMPLGLQAKLLSVIENRVLRPVGGTREKRVDVHIVAATNRNLEDAIAQGQFRADLYHRLRVLTFEMPPLRERENDIEQLTSHFLRLLSTRYNIRVTGVSDEAMAALRAYDWPGNVRELMHTLESAVLVADGATLRLEHLNLRTLETQRPSTLDIDVGKKSIQLDFGGDCPKLDEIEYHIISAALDFCKHNLSKAARILGISRDAIRYRLEKYSQRGP